MDCKNCQLSIEAYLSRTLSAPERTDLESHMAACAECRQELEAMRRLDASLSTRPLRMPPVDFTHSVLARIRRENVPAKADHWWVQILAYAASLAAVGFDLSRAPIRYPWAFLSEGMARMRAQLGSLKEPLIPDEPFAPAEAFGETLRSLFSRVDASLGPVAALRLPDIDIGLPEANAVMLLLVLTCVLYVCFSD